MRKAGFDITNFEPGVFEIIMEKFHLQTAVKEKTKYSDVENVFVFRGPNITVYTQNNPVTGEYWNPQRRDNQRGFASYIGVEGDNETVESFCKTVMKMCEFYKEYDPTARSFI